MLDGIINILTTVFNIIIVLVFAGVVCPVILSVVHRFTIPLHGLFMKLATSMGGFVLVTCSFIGRILTLKSRPKEFCTCKETPQEE